MIAQNIGRNIPAAIHPFPMSEIRETQSERGCMHHKEFREVKKMYCTHCGMPIPEDLGFCSHCNPVPISGYIDVPEDIVEQARSGDQDALTALYKKTQGRIFSSIKHMIRDEDAASDILQDSYIKAFTGLEKLEGNAKFFPWLRQIAINTAKDWMKKKKPLLFTELENETGQMLPAEDRFLEERSEFIPESLIERNETTRLIREIIDTLPENQRVVIAMFYYEELSVKQIAALTESSESAVKSRLMYGRQKIELKVRDLEKSGTKLYGLTPFSFFLLLLHSERVQAADLAPHKEILQNILEHSAKPPSIAGTTDSMRAAAAKTSASQVATIGIGKGVSFAASLSTAKIALLILSSIALIGAGAFGLYKLFQPGSKPLRSEKNAAPSEKPAKKKTEKKKSKTPKRLPGKVPPAQKTQQNLPLRKIRSSLQPKQKKHWSIIGGLSARLSPIHMILMARAGLPETIDTLWCRCRPATAYRPCCFRRKRRISCISSEFSGMIPTAKASSSPPKV